MTSLSLCVCVCVCACVYVCVCVCRVTLSCIQHFLAWIPLGFVFEVYMSVVRHTEQTHMNQPAPLCVCQTNLIGILIDQFWDPPEFRIECVKCLGEIAALHEGIDRYVDKLRNHTHTHTQRERERERGGLPFILCVSVQCTCSPG